MVQKIFSLITNIVNIELAIIAVVISGLFIILYSLLKRLSRLASKKRILRKVEENIRKRIEPVSKDPQGERHLVCEYEECVRTTKDREVKAWGKWLLARFYHDNPHRGAQYLKKAIDCYGEIVREFSDFSFHEETMFNLGNILFFEKFDHKRVCEVYQELLKRYPQSKWAPIARERLELVGKNLRYPQALNDYILAERYFGQAKYEKSIQNLRDIIERYPQSGLSSEASYFLGDIYHFKLKDYRKAIEEYQNLMQKFPQNRYVANGQFKIGECFRKLELWEEAIEAYRKFIENYSQYGYADYAQFYIGQCYEKLKSWQEAKSAYGLVSLNHPESIWTEVARNRIKYLERYVEG